MFYLPFQFIPTNLHALWGYYSTTTSCERKVGRMPQALYWYKGLSQRPANEAELERWLTYSRYAEAHRNGLNG